VDEFKTVPHARQNAGPLRGTALYGRKFKLKANLESVPSCF
jgi:hypothetical protein